MPLADLDPRRANRFNAFLDGLVEGRTASSSSVDPAMVKTASALHTFASITATAPARTHGWGRVRAWAPALSSSPARVARPRRVETRRGRLTAELATGLLVVLTVLGGAFAMSQGPSSQNEAMPDIAILLMDATTRPVGMLNPLTLEDLQGSDAMPLATPEPRSPRGPDGAIYASSSWHSCSGNGSMMRVDWDVPDPDAFNITYVVRDARSGAVWSRFEPPSGAYVLGVSRDCSRIVLTGNQFPPATWYVYDSRTGALLATQTSYEETVDLNWSGILDADARHVYRLVYNAEDMKIDPTKRESRPQATRLVSLDLDTGVERTSDKLPDVLGGNWYGSGQGLAVVVAPGLAISPEGGEIAVARADGTGLTLVDSASLAVLRTIDFPDDAVASRATPTIAPEHRVRTEAEVVFTPDGASVYVQWYSRTDGGDGPPEYDRSSLRRINLESNVVEATLPEGPNFLVLSPDGTALYGVWSRHVYSPQHEIMPSILRRLNPMTLAVEAERELPAGTYSTFVPLY